MNSNVWMDGFFYLLNPFMPLAILSVFAIIGATFVFLGGPPLSPGGIGGPGDTGAPGRLAFSPTAEPAVPFLAWAARTERGGFALVPT